MGSVIFVINMLIIPSSRPDGRKPNGPVFVKGAGQRFHDDVSTANNNTILYEHCQHS